MSVTEPARPERSEAQVGVRGKLKADAPLAPLVWFKSGGSAETLFEPADRDDLVAFLRSLDPAVPVMALGLGSNLIVRDGGVPGVVVRLGKALAKVEVIDAVTLKCGGGRQAFSCPRPRAMRGSRGSNSCVRSRARLAVSCG